jgi:hypothetical protein
MCRGLLNDKFTVPSWNGWLSKVADAKPIAVSTIGYMKPIFNPATDYSTVQQCLAMSSNAMDRLNQQYVFVTFDLAMAKIAYNIIWHSPDKYGHIIVNLGAFHTMCAYMAALGKMITGSGFEDILIDSGICASGSINQVLSGKHYNRSIRVHHHMLDAISHLILDAFIEQSSSDILACDQLKLLSL